MAATPGTGVGDKRAEEAILEPGADGEIPDLSCRTHPPCACPRCPSQEWIPQRSCRIASGAAKAPLTLGFLRSWRSWWFVFGLRQHHSKRCAPLSGLPLFGLVSCRSFLSWKGFVGRSHKCADYSVTIPRGGFVFHFPRVKSGIATGLLSLATDSQLAPTIALQAAASYTS